MRLTYSPEDEAFRAELVAWLEEHPPPPADQQEQRQSSAHMPAWAAEWQRTLFDHGWLVPGWPPELGGRNATAVQQMIYFEEFSARDVPRSFNPQGLSIITPSILDYGTEEQKERWAIPTLRAEITWCLGMSEPNAGSDLASLQTRAVQHGDAFMVNGQKVWTSGAHHADLCFCFVRTDPEAPKHKGISVLVIDMKTPGIETRPLPELTSPDYADFNEVFFTDVEVPAENLVGELNQGWPITRGSLVHERRMLWVSSANGLQRAVDALIELGHETRPDGAELYDDPRFRDLVANYFVDAQAALLMGYRGFAKSTVGKEPHEHSLLKMFGSEVEQRLCLTAHEWLGAYGLDRSIEAEPIWRQGSWAEQWMRSFAGTIAGGTSEIQRNILAERVLGLPRG
ncbi:MAG: acyl-CoA dehydrogenase family protein [Actinobacteria bacterium]|nr:acyl-CoA dehydrogenase family protein [Actinomycetota bacterium]